MKTRSKINQKSIKNQSIVGMKYSYNEFQSKSKRSNNYLMSTAMHSQTFY
jgi:hypothetical protein